MRPLPLALTLILSIANANANSPAGDSACENVNDEIPIAEAHGSVAIFANIRGAPDSIGVVAKKILRDTLARPAPNNQSCTGQCANAEQTIIYRVGPTAFVENSRQRKVCVALEAQTSSTPFSFGPRNFANVDALNTWIMNFSRGKGRDGKALYQMCEANCSPRYTFFINPSAQGYTVNAEVLCGLARDKSNDRYHLTTAVRTSCPTGELANKHE